MKSRLIAIATLLLLVLIGVWWWYTHRPVGPELRPVAFADIPGWRDGDVAPALAAFRRSCKPILAQPPDKPMGYGTVAADWAAACAATARDPRRFFEDNFRPYALDQGLATGYYEPLLAGSRHRHGRFQTPVYGRPGDLVSVDLGLFRPEWTGETIAGRVAGRRLLPYPTRADIDAHPPAAPVLFYGDDPVSVFFLHIQGSGRVRLDDASMLRVTYDSQNGRPYTPVGRILIARYGLAREGMSMQVIRDWLKAHPSQMREVLESDASFVFFKEAPVGDASLGPPGSEGVALTPRASIAIDPRFNPFGLPVFLSGGGLSGLYIAQDTGGAIRGAARADVFYGFGPAAELSAGGLKAHPDFFILLPRHVSG
jgi:membrane-bound lytic murein transglycosylase A